MRPQFSILSEGLDAQPITLRLEERLQPELWFEPAASWSWGQLSKPLSFPLVQPNFIVKSLLLYFVQNLWCMDTAPWPCPKSTVLCSEVVINGYCLVTLPYIWCTLFISSGVWTLPSDLAQVCCTSFWSCSVWILPIALALIWCTLLRSCGVWILPSDLAQVCCTLFRSCGVWILPTALALIWCTLYRSCGVWILPNDLAQVCCTLFRSCSISIWILPHDLGLSPSL